MIRVKKLLVTLEKVRSVLQDLYTEKHAKLNEKECPWEDEGYEEIDQAVDSLEESAHSGKQK